jgi:hypothetical protein
MSRLRPALLLAALAALSTPVAAQEAPARPNGFVKSPGPHFVLDAAFEFGGDLLGEVIFTDGSTQKIYAGQGGTFSAGLEYRLPRTPRVALAASIGYKFVTTAADNANIGFTRVPLEFGARVDLDRAWWVAGGLVHHAAIEFNGDGFAPDESFPGATGLTAEVGWKWFGVTYTAIGYDDSGTDLDASSIGFSFRWVFGRER